MAVVFNGSPLFSGSAGGGESEIRRHVVENDLLEAIIGLPEEMFFNTGISTYIWILSNRKPEKRAGMVQLIDARGLFRRMRKPLGEKRNELLPEHIDEIVRLYGDMVNCDRSLLLPNAAFGFRRVTVERPKRARFDPGPQAVERLQASEAWSTDQVRKADSSRADKVLAAVEDLISELAPTNTFADALSALQQAEAFKSLLKKAKDAVGDALLVEDPSAEPRKDERGVLVPNPGLSGQEIVPFPDGFDPVEPGDQDAATVGVEDYVTAEVHPYAADAWADHTKTKIGYEIPFTRIFYRYEPPRPLDEIDADIKEAEAEILKLLGQVTS